MKEIRLDKLSMKNFKGIKEKEFVFSKENYIHGKNGSGKTTIADAFHYLLFDKNSEGDSQFNIKTIDVNGEALHGLEHIVEATFYVDNKPVTLKKVYKEKWVKKRGSEESEMNGHTTEHFINSVPKKAGEYKTFINEMIDENIFKLITNPFEFSKLNWKDARNILFQITDEVVSDEEVLNSTESLKRLITKLEDKTVEEYESQVKYELREYRKKLREIPVKINTLNETIKIVDKKEITNQTNLIKAEIKMIEEKINDTSMLNEERNKISDEIYQVQKELRNIEREVASEMNNKDSNLELQLSELTNSMNTQVNSRNSLEREIASLINELDLAKDSLEEAKETYNSIMKETLEISYDIRVCPTCEREFEQDNIEKHISELQENFNMNKAKRAKEVFERHNIYKSEIEEITKKIEQKDEQIEIKSTEIMGLTQEIQSLENELKNEEVTETMISRELEKNVNYIAVKKKLEMLNNKLEKLEKADTSDLERDKQAKQEGLKSLEEELYQVKINQETEIKIKDLMTEEKQLNARIFDLMSDEFLLEDFTRTKSEAIESKINEKFEYVTFRLFKKQVNGGIEETCDILVNGVPFSDANQASKFNAGLDIIRSLNEFYQVKAPIFIDNRESVTEIIDTDNQIINLVVDKTRDLEMILEIKEAM